MTFCRKFLLVALTSSLATTVLAQPKEIILPAKSPAQRTVQLAEQWRIGGEDDEDVLLGVIANGVLDDAGNIYLLDSQLSQVLIINADGQQTGTLSREGEGPGELTRPTGIFLNNQNQIGVAQGFPGKIVLLNMDDTPGGTILPESDPETGGFAYIGEAIKRGENLVVNHGYGAFDMTSGKITSTTLLTGLDSQGMELGRFAEHVQKRELAKQVFDEKANSSELDTWALGDEYVYTVPHRDQYLINVKNMNGTVVQVISRSFEPRKRSDEDKEEMTSSFNVVVNGRRMEFESHILDFDPALTNMYVAHDGRLFVENCYQKTTLLPAGVAGRFDIVSAEGELVEELTLELPGFNPEQDRLAFLDGIHYLWIRNYRSASEAMSSGMPGNDASADEDQEDLEDPEPLEVVFCRVPG